MGHGLCLAKTVHLLLFSLVGGVLFYGRLGDGADTPAATGKRPKFIGFVGELHFPLGVKHTTTLTEWDLHAAKYLTKL